MAHKDKKSYNGNIQEIDLMIDFQNIIKNDETLVGKWSLKNSGRTKHYGSLKFDKGKVYLTIQGNFQSSNRVWKVDEIKGDTNQGKFVLKNCYQRKFSQHLFTGRRKDSTLVYEVSDVIHIEATGTRSSLNIKSLSATVPYLEFWFGKSLINHNFEGKKFEYTENIEHSYKYKGYKVFLGTHLKDLYSLNANDSSLKITQIGYVRLKFDKPTPYGTAINKYREVESIFRFIYMQQFFVKDFFGYSKTKLKNGDSYKTLNIYTSRVVNKDLEMPRLMHELFIFSLEQCDDFGSVLRKWLDDKDRFEPVYQLILMSNEPTVYIENQFMGLINACELFHRSFMLDVQARRPQNEWLEIKEKILLPLSGKYKKIVKASLRYENEPTLQERLEDMVRHISNTGFKGLSEATIKGISDTRNNFVHKKFGEISGPINLLEVNYALTELLAFSLLLELGFTHKEINKFSKNRFLFRYSNY